jgi:hypothetical protein
MGVTSFFADNCYHPPLNFDIKQQWVLLENHDAQKHAMKLQDIHSLIQAEMSFAFAKPQENPDQHCNSAPAYQVGDLVCLNAENIIMCCPSVKLD